MTFLLAAAMSAAPISGPTFVLSASNLTGIITFPSVHAAVAILCVWASWSWKRLRYPILGINLLMATSAIPCGGHYLVDVLAGIAVAAFVIVAVHWFARWPLSVLKFHAQAIPAE